MYNYKITCFFFYKTFLSDLKAKFVVILDRFALKERQRLLIVWERYSWNTFVLVLPKYRSLPVRESSVLTKSCESDESRLGDGLNNSRARPVDHYHCRHIKFRRYKVIFFHCHPFTSIG